MLQKNCFYSKMWEKEKDKSLFTSTDVKICFYCLQKKKKEVLYYKPDSERKTKSHD